MYFLSKAYNRLPINDLNWMPGSQRTGIRYVQLLNPPTHMDNFRKKMIK